SSRRFVVELRCKVLYELLRKPLDIERLRRFVEYSAECKSSFLRGFFDSEGCIAEDGRILVSNTDLKLLRYVKLLLSSLGVETSGPRLVTKHGTPFIDPRGKTYYTKKDIYYLYVPSDYRLNFYQHIGFTIKRKQQRLEDFLIRTGRLKPPAKPPLFFPNNTILI
ncbi:MAG: LAGLIDADG family homing endonuclease, partial [Nitrososphaerota archaeon]